MKKKFNFSKAIFPNTLTALNIFSGFTAIILISHGNYEYATLAVFFAALFDLTDGMIARLVKTSSQFGVELDSLADVVSFGAAPSFLIYKLYFHQLGVIGVILSSLPVVLGAFRLAKFNTMLEDLDVKADFHGLPIPMSALTLVSFVYNFHTEILFNDYLRTLLIIITIGLSLLMVSDIRYNSFPKLKKQSKLVKATLLVLTPVFFVVIYLTNAKVLFYIFISIVLFGIFRYLFSLVVPGEKKE